MGESLQLGQMILNEQPFVQSGLNAAEPGDKFLFSQIRQAGYRAFGERNAF
jgi:hypothetical protein